mmetsp:Transcript_18798/g.24215  ORF Transcript_18798/g.24215 Transcript_18798/m.24215 type:complete len:281 (+) Transcript_18798:84-926(+)|eukprot:CAMPEP_0198144066 /NCGR_PEP_ID=MMETSP1443-20131203/12634_1 /TAXON_ID=186043 /ORGANISM="Entomoneis sp., Strain CCMP2396" /LENGTH=280 /DNA_ID=CAMNT_0043807403 /DNA_START=21 /DNA_END=863 /DNA_ORIENTATION=-
MNYGMDYEGGDMGGGGHGTPSASMGGGGTQSSGSGPKRASQDEQTIRAVTINMMMQSQPQQAMDSTGLQLPDGRDLYHVKFVAAVRSFDDNSTHVMYSMEDGTGGVMEVKQWLDDNSECTAVSQIRQACSQEHIYLKVVGQLKDYDGRKMVLADSIRPLSTSNEITHHFLEVVYQGQMHKKGGKSAGTGRPAVQGFAGTPMMQASRGAPLAASGASGENPLHQDVLRGFTGSDDSGISIHIVVNELRTKYREDDIREVISSLVSEGKLYSTIDEEHYNAA